MRMCIITWGVNNFFKLIPDRTVIYWMHGALRNNLNTKGNKVVRKVEDDSLEVRKVEDDSWDDSLWK